jgi:hypothetical protein
MARRVYRTWTYLVLGSILGSVAACGGDDASAGPDGGPGGGPDGGSTADAGAPTLEDLCGPDGLFVEFATKVLACNPEIDFLLNGVTPTDLVPACQKGIGGYVGDGTTVLAGKTAFDVCAQALATLTCDYASFDEPGACGDVVVGTQPVNGSCEDDAQCAGDSYCDQSAGTTCGACAARKANGMACTSNHECSGGGCLLQDIGAKKCGALGDVGASCIGESDCKGNLLCAQKMCARPTAPQANQACDLGANYSDALLACRPLLTGLYCRPNGPQTTVGTCQAHAAIGATCVPLGQLGAPWCNFGKYEVCKDQGGGVLKCVAPTIMQSGQACSVLTGQKCAAGLRCGDHDDDMQTPDECFAPLAEGATCDPAGNDECDVFMTCDEATKKCRYDYSGMCPVAT